MTRSSRYSTLLILLLGFFLNGCATTDKNVKADKNTENGPAAAADSGAKTDSSAKAGSDAVAGTTANSTAGTGSGTNAANNDGTAKNVPASASAAPDSAKTGAQAPVSGPVFKNAAPSAYPPYSKKDPWEPMNRAVFGFNESLDDYLLRPVAKGYRWIMPDPLENAVGNVFSNLNDIPITLNNLLQLKFNNALTSSMRVVVNTSFGLGGIIDLASDIGLEKHDEDFGQTLGYHGVASGPYLVLPFLGPSTTRDAGGRVLDIATDPVFVGSFFVAPFIGPIVGSTRAADTRAGLLKSEKTLDEAALDKYEFVRDAYLQRRRNLVYDGNPPKQKDEDDAE
ncbi:MAG TPA: VacJ family lipoprotein [Nitrosospira sp.]|jgi:phospholipid-binding lipoprotein MlaA|nr:VacJ family lipoprotein [Nitrosospira sp.]